jgi:hypothetical protein
MTVPKVDAVSASRHGDRIGAVSSINDTSRGALSALVEEM